MESPSPLSPSTAQERELEIRRLVESLEHAAEDMGAALPGLEQRATLGQVRGLTPQAYEALCRLAFALCEEGDFQRGAAVALQLLLHEPTEAKYAFLAATCLQRLGHREQAASLYGMSHVLEPTPIAAYRTGECLAALGDTDTAAELFYACMEACRGNDELRELQEMASKALGALPCAV